MRKVTKGNVTIKLWDLGGQPRFRSMWERYCRAVSAIVYVLKLKHPLTVLSLRYKFFHHVEFFHNLCGGLVMYTEDSLHSFDQCHLYAGRFLFLSQYMCLVVFWGMFLQAISFDFRC